MIAHVFILVIIALLKIVDYITNSAIRQTPLNQIGQRLWIMFLNQFALIRQGLLLIPQNKQLPRHLMMQIIKFMK